MAITSSAYPRRTTAGLLAVCCLALTACGGGDDADESGSDSPAAQDADSRDDAANDSGGDAGSSDVPAGFDIPEGLPVSDGLIPELVVIPLPGGPAVFSVGDAYDANVDPRETAVQAVHFTISQQEVADFYRTELPAAGFVIVADSADQMDPANTVEGQQIVIEFTDPSGLPGHISINPGAFSEASININLFRSGTR